MRAPADKERRRILCASIRRHAADHLIARGILRAADHGIAHRKSVERIEVIVCIAVEDIRGNGVREPADKRGVLTAAELLAVRCKCQLLNVDTRTIFENNARVLHLHRRRLVPRYAAVDAAHRGLRHRRANRRAVTRGKIAHLPRHIIHNGIGREKCLNDEIDTPVGCQTLPQIGKRQCLCSECCHSFVLL